MLQSNALFVLQLGIGLVGGRLFDWVLLGKEAAGVVLRILRGEPAIKDPSRTRIERCKLHSYDWGEFGRWQIDEDLLPPGSTGRCSANRRFGNVTGHGSSAVFRSAFCKDF